jgi:hypothetical protein
MAKAIDNKNIWYQEVSPRSFYDEEDLERAIIHNLQIIFPQFKALPFKKSLFDIARHKRNKPDLAMVKADYSEWYIIEVELGKHSKDHVTDQIQTFFNCSYVDEHAEYIHSQRSHDLDLNSLKAMVAAKVPEFMVIVNEPKSDWVDDLKSLRCKTCIFQIYHDFDGKPLYRLNGDHPYIYTKFCHCKYQKVGSPYTVEVLDKQFLDSYGINDGATVPIECNGLSLQWLRQDDSNRIFLHCDTATPPLDSLTDRYRLNFNDALKTYSFTKD